ncbi:MAG: aldehyde ferredoxin oxidoreductase family protein [Chloroflexota bacterium]|nr:aldehyde ferredoxin oxidoreductase family protein [Chloroflexota bacterium]MED5569133.1 aldehyde ferredoxin oxidoreductase family protein [Chloroflexota bacterium]
MYGYHGKALVVDLSSGAHRWDNIPEQVLRSFIGGIGLGTYLLYKYCPAGADPLGPDNPLIFAASPLVGSRLTTSSKFAVMTKSPLTGFIGDSLSSSFLATELKKSCGDALIIVGQAETPTLLFIENGVPQFLDAAGLMGLGTFDTEQAVKERLGRQTRVASIGPAGENLVRYASIANDGGRQAGRCGPGAVMGSKNLKALALQGSQTVDVAMPGATHQYSLDLSKRSLGAATEKYRELGTMANVSVFNRLGTLPTRNFRESTFEGAEKVSGEHLHQEHLAKNASCANCTIGCEKILVTSDKGKKSKGRMEYESLFALGPLCGVDDPNTVIRAAAICDDLGMDTISAGVTIAWAMECFDKGLLSTNDTGGIDLSFGNGQAILDILELIGHRKDLGGLLAEGTKMAAERLGGGSSDWAMQVKGLEMPGYEPRSLKTMALGLAVTPRGACHNRSSTYEADFSEQVDRLSVDESRGIIAAESEDFEAVLDSLIWCKFLRKAFNDFYEESAQVYTMITGWDMSLDELKQAGERIHNLKKLFNIREGWSRRDDALPPRTLQEPLPTGVVAGVGLTQEELDYMIAGYYRARGWNDDGSVPDTKLAELGLLDLLPESSGVAIPT